MKNHILSTICLIICSLPLVANAQQSTPSHPSAIVTLEDGSVAIANKTTKNIEIYNSDFSKKIRTIALSDSPTGITKGKNATIFVTTFQDGRSMIHRIGAQGVEKSAPAPYGATYPIYTDDKLFVAGQFANSVAQFDPQTLQQSRTVRVPREPKAIAATDKHLFVLNFLPATAANLDYVACDVSVVDLASFKVIKNIKLANGSNALRDILLTKDGKYILVSHNLGRYTVPTTQLQQGWMNTSAVSVIDAQTLLYKGAIIVDEPNRGAAGTWGMAQAGDKILVSHSGTHDISVIDYQRMIDKLENYKGGVDVLAYDLRFLYSIRQRVPLTGNGPRAMSVSSDGSKVYVPTYFSDTINIVELKLENQNAVSWVALNPSRSENLAQVGERVFNDATFCFQNWQSCNGCHPGEARTDGMNWDLVNDGIGNSKNCKSLLYSIQTPPSMISGIRTSALIANRKGFTHIQFSTIPEDLALAVDAYTSGLQAVASPYLANGQLSEKAQAGRKVFEKLGCDECHSGPYYTDMKMHRIGADIEFATGWDTPTLREVWRTAPYLFDGRAATMREVFSTHKHGVTQKISERQIDELTEYVNSL